jgi:hypothetical protein
MEGKKIFEITLVKENPMIGSGSYQYVEKKAGGIMPDVGTYRVLADQSRKKLYVQYSNLLPSGIAAGYEIWEQQ